MLQINESLIMKGKLTHSRLLEVLDYNPETGEFTNKIDRGGLKAGDIVGSDNGRGYLTIGIDGTSYRAHRLAYFYVNGVCPTELQIDHINHIRSDNRIDNLRLVTPPCNAENGSRRCDSTSDIKGISWNKILKKWHVLIQTTRTTGKSKQYNIASHSDKPTAILMRNTAEHALGFNGCNDSSDSCLFVKKHHLEDVVQQLVPLVKALIEAKDNGTNRSEMWKLRKALIDRAENLISSSI
jgi:hypothetical protein